MSRSLVFLVAVWFLLLPSHHFAQAPAGGGAPGQIAPQPSPGTARIRGRVTAAGSNTPLRRVQMILRLPESPQFGRRVIDTDAEGRYEFTELPAGRFSLSASRPGYVGLQYGQRRPYESGTPIALSAGNDHRD